MGYRISETYTYLPMRELGLCLTPLKGHYKLFGAPIRAKFTPLNRVPFGKFNVASGPRECVNPKLFEAVRPCLLGFSEQAPHGWAKKFIQRSEKGGWAKSQAGLFVLLMFIEPEFRKALKMSLQAPLQAGPAIALRSFPRRPRLHAK